MGCILSPNKAKYYSLPMEQIKSDFIVGKSSFAFWLLSDLNIYIETILVLLGQYLKHISS